MSRVWPDTRLLGPVLVLLISTEFYDIKLNWKSGNLFGKFFRVLSNPMFDLFAADPEPVVAYPDPDFSV